MSKYQFCILHNIYCYISLPILVNDNFQLPNFKLQNNSLSFSFHLPQPIWQEILLLLPSRHLQNMTIPQQLHYFYPNPLHHLLPRLLQQHPDKIPCPCSHSRTYSPGWLVIHPEWFISMYINLIKPLFLISSLKNTGNELNDTRKWLDKAL